MRLKPVTVLLIAIAFFFVAVGGMQLYHRAKLRFSTESDLFSLGQVAANRGNCKRAVEFYTALLQKDPRHSVAMDFMINCQIQIGDFKAAIQSSENLIKIDPMVRHKERLVRLYEQVGEKEKVAQLKAEIARNKQD